MNIKRLFRIVAGIVLIATAMLLAGCTGLPPVRDIGLTGAEFYPPPEGNPAAGHRELSLRQQHEPTAHSGRVLNAAYCDAIEALGFTTEHATHQLYCQQKPFAVPLPQPASVVASPAECPVQDAVTCPDCPRPRPPCPQQPAQPPQLEGTGKNAGYALPDWCEHRIDHPWCVEVARRYAVERILEAAMDRMDDVRFGCENMPDRTYDRDKPHTYVCEDRGHEAMQTNWRQSDGE